MVKSLRFSPAPSLENCDRPLLNAAFPDRQFGDAPRVDDLPEAGRRSIDRDGGGAHRDLVGDVAGRQRRVHGQHVGDVQFDLAAPERAEPVECHAHTIGTGNEERHPVVALVVRRRRRLESGGEVGDRDGRARHHPAALIDHLALNGSACLLRVDRRRPPRQETHHQQPECSHHVRLRSSTVAVRRLEAMSLRPSRVCGECARQATPLRPCGARGGCRRR